MLHQWDFKATFNQKKVFEFRISFKFPFEVRFARAWKAWWERRYWSNDWRRDQNLWRNTTNYWGRYFWNFRKRNLRRKQIRYSRDSIKIEFECWVIRWTYDRIRNWGSHIKARRNRSETNYPRTDKTTKTLKSSIKESMEMSEEANWRGRSIWYFISRAYCCW